MLFMTIIAGFLIGLISGLIGIGGGTMLVPLFIFAFDMDIHRAVGTSLAVIAPVSLVGAFFHSLKGNVDFVPVLAVTAAACAGIFLSGQVIHLVSSTLLKRAFAAFLLYVAVQLVVK